MEPSPCLPQEETWRIDDLFDGDDAFERDVEEFRRDVLPTVDRHEGRLAESAVVLAEALESISAAGQRLHRLHCYAALRSDGDTRCARYQAMRQTVDLLGTEFSRRDSYLEPEILRMDPQRIEAWLAGEPRLAPYRHFVHDLLRRRTHVLSPPEEQILAQSGLVTREASSLYHMLTNAELPRPELTLSTGETIRVTPVAFHKHRTTAHRGDRLKLFPAYLGAYAAFRSTLGQNLYAAVKSHLFRSRVRGYESCLAAALEPDYVPETVYRTLIRQVRERLGVLHRYFAIRARRLGLERLEYPDLYGPLGTAPPRRFPTSVARRLVLDGLTPLGGGYQVALEAAFASRWIDWHPAAGKRSGAYANGWAYEIHPYVLLNYNGDHESVMTLAHEMGHAMHSHFSNRAQPFPTADYSIFVAEVASTFNESLLLSRMLAAASSEEETLFVLASYLDGIRGTLFRQTMFSEFELAIHERAERGEVLTGEALDELYLRLLREYHGHDQGVTHIADEYAVEWAAIPHMYYNFYVYQYATGIVAATALARGVLEERPGARERYLEFLCAGGSDYPLALLRRAGVDLESSEPYTETFAAIDRQLDLLEACLAAAPAIPPAR